MEVVCCVLKNVNVIKKSRVQGNKIKYILNKIDIDEMEKNSGISDSLGELKTLGKIKEQISNQLIEIDKLKKVKEIKLEEMIKNISDIDEIIERYDFQGSNLIQMLLDVQAEYNWLPKHALYHIGDKLDVPLTRVYNIASFYKFFNLEPRGKHSIVVCTGTACHVRGSMSLLQRIVNVLDVKPGDTTEDMKFTLDTVNCLGVCALGPVMMLDKQY